MEPLRPANRSTAVVGDTAGPAAACESPGRAPVAPLMAGTGFGEPRNRAEPVAAQEFQAMRRDAAQWAEGCDAEAVAR